MSADNWMVCPKCNTAASKKRESKIQKAKSSYGKVSEDAYRNLIADAEKPSNLEETFREDYELGMKGDGSFFVSYSGYCTTCGFEHTFKHEQQVPL